MLKKMHVVLKLADLEKAHGLAAVLLEAFKEVGIKANLADSQSPTLFKPGPWPTLTRYKRARTGGRWVEVQEKVDTGQLFKMDAVGVLIMEHQMSTDHSRIRPPIPATQVSYHHPLQVSVVAEPGTGKTSIMAFIQQVVEKVQTFKPDTKHVSLDNWSEYPDSDLKTYLASSENLSRLADHICIEISAQELQMVQDVN